jgi:hypothetical protein
MISGGIKSMSKVLYSEICHCYKSPLTLIALTKYLESNSHSVRYNTLKMIGNVFHLLTSYYPLDQLQNLFLKHSVLALRLFEFALSSCTFNLKMLSIKVLYMLIEKNSLGIALLCR